MTTRFGLLVPHFGVEADQDLLIEGAKSADRLGFDSLWVRDHLVFHPHGMEGTDRTFVEPFTTLTYLAGVTERIGLGAATIIPFRHPVHLAYSVASMSWITRRRFDLGIGAGNFQHEFDVIDMGHVKRPDLMKEHTLIARRLWAGESVAHKSELYDFEDVDLKPQPLFPVPVWWGGATPASSAILISAKLEPQNEDRSTNPGSHARDERACERVIGTVLLREAPTERKRGSAVSGSSRAPGDPAAPARGGPAGSGRRPRAHRRDQPVPSAPGVSGWWLCCGPRGR